MSERPTHLYIYSPSGAVRDKAGFRRAVKRLGAMGYQVEVDPDALASHERFAGDDATRLAAISRAAASRADIAMPTRGGYGLTRLLDRLPYKALDRAIERGTRFVGHSDFTALQLALLAKTGATTWAGPLFVDDFGIEGELDEIMLACFEDLCSGQGEGAGWRLPPRSPLPLHWRGAHDAVLWGGNLCVITSLLGTPYFPQIEGGVLFLEDIGEHPYRVERMLDQLRLAGVLGRQRAILLGQFTGTRPTSHDRGFSMKTVSSRLAAQLKVSVLEGLPFGHVSTKITLPIGATIDMAMEGREAVLVWGHQHARGD